MEKQLGFIFNPELCIGCKACEVACKSENDDNCTISRRKVIKHSFATYISISCNHCQNPECFRVCPENAFIKRTNGIVEIDANRCTSCMNCLDACPYHAPQYDPITQKVVKCQMCSSRLESGLTAACVEACPTTALTLSKSVNLHHHQYVRSIDGLPDYHFTQPSILFNQNNKSKKKHYFLN
ncbi:MULTISPECIES: 4Fe-4S dicluster domain-containing protein [Bacillus]|uniref:4Fe-4S dicluster domain-containing protein n=1 Tax=Bacillus TaxID=1386 RepID=UPI0002FC8ED9|nr:MULTISPECIES: 4Fe-4S dicluster domain-containing protein [Bacillus]